jgi:xanthine dehydrogenase YagS FAD-binding subunit
MRGSATLHKWSAAMESFSYVAVTHQGQAIQAADENPHATFLAGGTNLVDDMKLGIEKPDELIDINKIPLNKIEESSGGLRIGALVRNSDLAWDAKVQSRYPVLSQALLSGASAQLRNMASTGGNLLQRTRCYYFRDVSYPCNKREPGSGCPAIAGFNRIHAVLGTSDKCIATHPSDMCVAMSALDAVIHVTGQKGDRKIPINDFYVAYGDDPAKENMLEHGELIVAVEIPSLPWAKRSHYLKVRDRASYEFALASAAIILNMDGNTIREARIAMGGVGSKPWRCYDAEKSLAGKAANEDSFKAAAEIVFKDAKPQKYNAFKIELGKRTLVQALTDTTKMG